MRLLSTQSSRYQGNGNLKSHACQDLGHCQASGVSPSDAHRQGQDPPGRCVQRSRQPRSDSRR